MLKEVGSRDSHPYIRSLQQLFAFFGVTRLVYSPIQMKFAEEDDLEMSVLFSFLIALLVSALVIYIVGRLNLGLTVDSYGSAIIAAIVIAIVTAVVNWLLGLLGLTIGGGWLGAIVLLVVAAIILMISDRFLPGMKVSGFVGAIVAAVAIAVVSWLLAWVLSFFGIVV
jgi:putative membrane protein